MSVIQLQMSCSVHNQEITVLPYFTMQKSVRPKSEPFLALLKESNFSEVKIWEPFLSTYDKFTHVK